MKESSKKPDFSFKNATRGTSQKDQTMNSLLQDLRRSRDLNQKKSSSFAAKGALPLRASMFMTQDGEKDYSIVEDPGNDSDSDVDVSDFRPQKAPQHLSPLHDTQFNDSINTGGEPLLETASLHAPPPQSLPVGIAEEESGYMTDTVEAAPPGAQDTELQSATS